MVRRVSGDGRAFVRSTYQRSFVVLQAWRRPSTLSSESQSCRPGLISMNRGLRVLEGVLWASRRAIHGTACSTLDRLGARSKV